MHDAFTGTSVDVRFSERCGPYIMVEPAKIALVEELLRNNDIPFTLDNGGNDCMGAPEAAVFEFSREVDAARIQRVLDSVQ